MIYEPRKPQRLGAERRETEAGAIDNIAHGKTTAKCPECGSEHYYPTNGCMLCQACGYTPCGVH